jgi:hypothetical protein
MKSGSGSDKLQQLGCLSIISYGDFGSSGQLKTTGQVDEGAHGDGRFELWGYSSETRNGQKPVLVPGLATACNHLAIDAQVKEAFGSHVPNRIRQLSLNQKIKI